MYKEMLYNDLSTFLSLHFPFKVQKISINAGFTCPNRDGSIGYGGCTYCNNQTFNPAYCHTDKSVGQQLEEGKRFFSGKYPDMKYLAYFQAYTNTYGELEELKHKYEEALTVADVVGLVIGTRPPTGIPLCAVLTTASSACANICPRLIRFNVSSSVLSIPYSINTKIRLFSSSR